MKLNKKGLMRLLDVAFDGDEFYQSNALEVEFKPGDLEDCVMLTIKEAKEILQSFYDVLSWSMVGPTHRDNAVYVQNLLKYRIEQAESTNDSN